MKNTGFSQTDVADSHMRRFGENFILVSKIRSCLIVKSNDMPLLSDSSTSKVVELTLHQSAFGSFPPKAADQLKPFGIESENIESAGKKISSEKNFATVWITLVVVALLTEKQKGEKELWELVVGKAKKWLQKNVDPTTLITLETKSKEFISAIYQESKRMCPSGHPLFVVGRRDGSMWHCDSLTQCVGGCAGDGAHSNAIVWRCSNDWRMKIGGTCDFDLCGECIKQNI